jgi:hypothetical protein
MERAQKAYRNFKQANAAFRAATANLRKREYITELMRFPNLARDPRTRILANEYNKAHQNVRNAFVRRTKAHNALVKEAANIGVRNASVVNRMRNMLKYAPPNRPGGFGGIEYEMTALRWRKKPNRAKSASPKRRRASSAPRTA